MEQRRSNNTATILQTNELTQNRLLKRIRRLFAQEIVHILRSQSSKWIPLKWHQRFRKMHRPLHATETQAACNSIANDKRKRTKMSKVLKKFTLSYVYRNCCIDLNVDWIFNAVNVTNTFNNDRQFDFPVHRNFAPICTLRATKHVVYIL